MESAEIEAESSLAPLHTVPLLLFLITDATEKRSPAGCHMWQTTDSLVAGIHVRMRA